MTFKFNFGGEAPATERSCEGLSTTPQTAESQVEAREILGEEEDLTKQSFDIVSLTPDVSLLKGSIASQKCSIVLKSGALAVSDLIPGSYEGGFKLWECAVDLAEHLCTLWGVKSHHNSKSWLQSAVSDEATEKRVLDLGCGHGLPGILAACIGMETHFQDYNKEVLTSLTMPNVTKNLSTWSQGPDCDLKRHQTRFFSGSWVALKRLMQEKGLSETYDFVLSSDTIYSPASQDQLVDSILEALKPGGQAFIAAKAYYFGVGGGTEQFKQLAIRSGRFAVQDGPVFDDGASNKREIFVLRKI